MPGVLIIEALAQVAGVLGFKSQEKKPKDGYLYYFVGADNVRLRRPVVPGDRLTLKAEIETARKGIYKFKCTALVDDELVSEMNIMCAERKVQVDRSECQNRSHCGVGRRRDRGTLVDYRA